MTDQEGAFSDEDIASMEAETKDAQGQDTAMGATLNEAVEEAYNIKNEIAETEAHLKMLKKDFNTKMEVDIPKLMDQVGVGEVGLTIGNRRVRLALDYKCFGTLRKAPDFSEAVSYLEAHGFEGGVLTTVSVDYREEESDQAENLAESIEALGKHPTVAKDVNSATLRSFVRTAYTEDTSFDAKKVGCVIVRNAKFTIS